MKSPNCDIYITYSGRYVDCSTHHQQCFPTTFLSFPQLHLCGCVLAWWLFLEGGSCRMISSYALWCTVGGNLRSDIAQCFTLIVPRYILTLLIKAILHQCFSSNFKPMLGYIVTLVGHQENTCTGCSWGTHSNFFIIINCSIIYSGTPL